MEEHDSTIGIQNISSFDILFGTPMTWVGAGNGILVRKVGLQLLLILNDY